MEPSCLSSLQRATTIPVPLLSVQLFACIIPIDEIYIKAFGGGDALWTAGVFSGGGAARQPEPGCAGDVPYAADADGAAEVAGGGGRGSALRQDEPGDAAHGGREGVFAVCRALGGELRGGKAASGGATERFGRAARARGVAGGRDLCVARVVGAVHGGLSAGVCLGGGRALQRQSG